MRDTEPGEERPRVAQRLAAKNGVEVGGAIVGAAQIGREGTRPQALVAQLLGQLVALGACGVGLRERLVETLAHIAQLGRAAVELARRALRLDVVGGEKDRAVGIEAQRPSALGARRSVGERDDDAPVGDIQAYDARGEHVVALGLELRGAVRKRHERVGAGQQLDLETVVAAPPHAHAHDVARACLLRDRRKLIGLERLQVEPGRAVGRELAHACTHTLADAQHVVAGVDEAAREVARAHPCAAVGECERRRARVERDDLALDVVADRDSGRPRARPRSRALPAGPRSASLSRPSNA